MCVCVCVCVCVRVRACVSACMRACVRWVYMCMHVHVYVRPWVCVCINAYNVSRCGYVVSNQNVRVFKVYKMFIKTTFCCNTTF